MNLTQKGKINSHLMCTKTGNCVGKEVRSGTEMVIRCRESRGRGSGCERGLGVRMEIVRDL